MRYPLFKVSHDKRRTHLLHTAYVHADEIDLPFQMSVEYDNQYISYLSSNSECVFSGKLPLDSHDSRSIAQLLACGERPEYPKRADCDNSNSPPALQAHVSALA